MLIFIDESGDPGFKLDKGSTPIFVATMVLFRNGTDAATTQQAIARSGARQAHKGEFKFSRCSDLVRDQFFEAVKGCPFRIRAIVVEKARIYSPHLRADKAGFYRFFVRQMMTNDAGQLSSAKVVIDGSGDREFRRALAAYLRRQLRDRLREVRFSNSRNDVLVQLADMCCGAIARSYRQDRGDPGRWRRMLRPRIDDVWEFR
ncbi:MAG TPA: DUF3800 domain-containing protein [Alphaproteobacteria bacterium]|nr:DUF3800 domain-containing protein [Alphaproteobacteria bacterium]